MKKTVAFLKFILSLNLCIFASAFAGENLFAQNSVQVANRQTALRCLQLAKSYINRNSWNDVNSRIKMGLAYDDSISDLWYFDALVKNYEGKNRAEIKPSIEKAFELNNWVDYNRDNARILYADLLFYTGNPEKSLEILNQEPFLFSSDAEFIRLKDFYLKKDSESLQKAREKVDSVRKVYPLDSRFARLFFENEFDLLAGSTEILPEVQKIADAFISIMPRYSDYDSELEFYSIAFSVNDSEKYERLLKSFIANGKSHPCFAELALKAGIFTEREAVDNFIQFANTSVPFEYLKSLVSLITEEETAAFFAEYLNSYEGILTFDTDGDLEPNFFVDYSRGRPENLYWDKDNDGVNEWNSVCDYGNPLTVFIPNFEFSANYGTYPYLVAISYKNSAGQTSKLNFEDNRFEYNPFTMKVVSEIQEALKFDFFFPEINFENKEPDFDLLYKNAFSLNLDVDSQTKIEFSLVDGNVNSAVYYENGNFETPYAQTFFENGLPSFRSIDRNGDGIYETTETYGIDTTGNVIFELGESESFTKSLYGEVRDRNGLYIRMIQVDQNGDTKPDFTEEYSEFNGKISSWDFDNDGIWDTRYVRYPQKSGESLIEDSVFYFMPDRILTTVTTIDGKPSKVSYGEVEFPVTKGENQSFYWVGDVGNSEQEMLVMQKLSSVATQGVSVLIEADNARIQAVAVSGMNFAHIIQLPEEEQKLQPKMQEVVVPNESEENVDVLDKLEAEIRKMKGLQ